MSIDVIIDPPLPTDPPTVFDQKAFQAWAAINQWAIQANATAQQVNQDAAKVEDPAVQAVAENIAVIQAVDGNKTNINAVAGNSANINAVNANKNNIDDVANNGVSISAVAGNAENINSVASISAEIAMVAAMDDDVAAVAAVATAVPVVAAIDSQVAAVASNASNINAVAGVSSAVTVVAAMDGAVTAVAAVDDDVTTVAQNLALLERTVSVANFKGRWSDLTGPLSVPASVYHSEKYWQLLTNLLDISGSEPGVSADWAEAGGGSGSITSADITDSTTTGRGVLTASSQSAARNAIGAPSIPPSGIPISNGVGGWNSPSKAVPQGDIVGTSAGQTITNKIIGGGMSELVATEFSINLAVNTPPFSVVDLVNNHTPFINLPVGVSRTVWINPKTWTVTWPAGLMWSGDGSVPDLVANAWSCITFTGRPGSSAGMAALVGVVE